MIGLSPGSGSSSWGWSAIAGRSTAQNCSNRSDSERADREIAVVAAASTTVVIPNPRRMDRLASSGSTEAKPDAPPSPPAPAPTLARASRLFSSSWHRASFQYSTVGAGIARSTPAKWSSASA